MAGAADTLLADVRAVLQITWTDAATDARITELISAGKAYLDDKYGAAADYTVSGYPRTLLFEYVRYARDAALDVFENNYRSLILAMQHKKAVSDYALEST